MDISEKSNPGQAPALPQNHYRGTASDKPVKGDPWHHKVTLFKEEKGVMVPKKVRASRSALITSEMVLGSKEIVCRRLNKTDFQIVQVCDAGGICTPNRIPRRMDYSPDHGEKILGSRRCNHDRGTSALPIRTNC